jgi:hypothetical protein
VNAVDVVGAVLTRVGLVLLALAAIALLVAVHRGRLARRLTDTPALSCAALVEADPLPGRVILAGQARPGAADTLVGPLSGEPCVWYRLDLRLNRPGAKRRPVFRYATPGPVTVDDGTGAIHVSGAAFGRFLWDEDINRGLHVDLVEHTFLDVGQHPEMTERMLAAGIFDLHQIGHRRRAWYELHEMRLVEGKQVTVLGRPRRADGGVLLDARAGDGTAGHDLTRLRRAAWYESRDTGRTARGFGYTGGALLVVGVLLRGLVAVVAH